MSKINIAIDGTAGSGKSTVSKLLASDLGMCCLSAGDLYRTLTTKCIQNSVDFSNVNQIVQVLNNVDIDIKYEGNIPQIFMDNRVVDADNLHAEEISLAVPFVAKIPDIRKKVKQLQKDLASKFDIVMEGRDIGTVVLPNADVKLFLTASPEVRADRRYRELQNKGEVVDREEILADIIERDKLDSTREISPLKAADDAIIVDTSNMNPLETTQYVYNLVQEKLQESREELGFINN